MASQTPYTTAHRHLSDLQLQLHARAHTQRTLDAIRQQLQEERVHHERVEADLRREGRDVARLAGLSIAALVAALRGTRDDDLAREQKEELAARLAAEASAAAVAALEDEEASLIEHLAAYGDLDTAYAAALHAKEEALVALNHPAAQQLHALDAALTEHDAAVQELDEALAAGESAREGLRAVREALEGAQGWGTWDMLGGGLLVTAVKHQRIDEARAAAHTAGQRLRRFQAEIGDVPLDRDPGDLGAINPLTIVGDYLFDGLFVDWFVQAKIERALDQTGHVQLAVRDLLAALDERRQTVAREQAEIIARREALVANA